MVAEPVQRLVFLSAGGVPLNAIEDTAALVRCLDSKADTETALQAYERQRSRRVAAFVRASRRS
jgi:2-polyprenyl-6-methoxyphenol hydroxylase-like FAD-dependent oxidoreductase